MTSASMELRKWRGNSIVCSDEAGAKVLGITWETELDQMLIAPDTPTEDQRWTRGSLLKFIASIFDPLGYITSFTIAGMILLQQSWKESNDWDAPFAGHLQERTQQWGHDIAQVSKFQVPRWIGAVEGQEYDLHLFTDASESAYACCFYICLKDSAQLIYSKGKVAPLRTISLTRLELQAAFLGAKCADFICQELRIKILEVHAWTDSITVWH